MGRSGLGRDPDPDRLAPRMAVDLNRPVGSGRLKQSNLRSALTSSKPRSRTRRARLDDPGALAQLDQVLRVHPHRGTERAARDRQIEGEGEGEGEEIVLPVGADDLEGKLVARRRFGAQVGRRMKLSSCTFAASAASTGVACWVTNSRRHSFSGIAAALMSC